MVWIVWTGLLPNMVTLGGILITLFLWLTCKGGSKHSRDVCQNDWLSEDDEIPVIPLASQDQKHNNTSKYIM